MHSYLLYLRIYLVLYKLRKYTTRPQSSFNSQNLSRYPLSSLEDLSDNTLILWTFLSAGTPLRNLRYLIGLTYQWTNKRNNKTRLLSEHDSFNALTSHHSPLLHDNLKVPLRITPNETPLTISIISTNIPFIGINEKTAGVIPLQENPYQVTSFG